MHAWVTRLVLITLVVSPGVAAPQTAAAEVRTDVLPRATVTVFSDKSEKASSGTTVELKRQDGALAIHYRVPEHPALRYAYAAVSLKLGEPLAFEPLTLEFDARRSATAGQPVAVTLRTRAGKSYRRELGTYGTVTESWQAFRVPLSDLAVPPEEAREIESIGLAVASHSVKDDVSLLEGVLYLRDVRFTDRAATGTVELPDYRTILAGRSEVRRPVGHAAWVYGADEGFLRQIAEFNATSPVPIDLLFVSAASVVVPEGEEPRVTPFVDDLHWYLERVPAGTEVHAMVGGDGRALGALSWEAQEALAAEVAARVNADPRLDGVHFDIEPYVIENLPFYVAVKRACDKPLSIALGKWDRHVIWVADYPVVMAYDKSKDPAGYGRSAGAMIAAFADDAAKVGRQFYAGVAFAQTGLEYEYEEHATTGQRTYTGAKMEEYARAALEVIAPPGARSGEFGGVSVWGFMPERSRIHAEWMKRPRHVKPEALAELRAFSARLAPATRPSGGDRGSTK